jgi:hypothetical protein
VLYSYWESMMTGSGSEYIYMLLTKMSAVSPYHRSFNRFQMQIRLFVSTSYSLRRDTMADDRYRTALMGLFRSLSSRGPGSFQWKFRHDCALRSLNASCWHLCYKCLFYSAVLGKLLNLFVDCIKELLETLQKRIYWMNKNWKSGILSKYFKDFCFWLV